MVQSSYIVSIPGKGLATFLFDSQIISCESTISSLSAQELINAIREAEDSTVGIEFPKIADASGKDPLSLTVAVGITLTLLENWTIYSQKSSGLFTLESGNIIRHDATTPFYPNTNVVYQSMLIQGGVIAVISSGSGLSPEESAKLLGLPSATDTANTVWSSSTASSWGLGSFGEWVKSLLTKNFFLGAS